MMIYLIFVIFVIDDRLSDSDRSGRYSWYFDSVSDSDSLLTIVTIFLAGQTLGKNDDISDIRDICDRR